MPQEEAKLKKLNEALDSMIPADLLLDQAIISGMEKGRVKKRKRHKHKIWLAGLVAAAILFVGFSSLIYTSPVFADYISKIPGMEAFVDYLRLDKGLTDAVKHDYQEIIGLSQKKNGIELTIDSVIKDESGLIVFYSVASDEYRTAIKIENGQLLSHNRKEIESSYETGNELKKMNAHKKYQKKIAYSFIEPFKMNDFYLPFTVTGEGLKEHFTFHLALKKSKAKSKVYQMNKTFSFAGQKITLESVIINPLRADIYLKQDPANPKLILQYDHLRIVDEKGEEWSIQQNGISGSGSIKENEYHIYLQSNYFKHAEKLYIVFDRMQAVDRDKAAIVIDTANKKILSGPDGHLQWHMEKDMISFDKELKEKFQYSVFGDITDAKGRNIEMVGEIGEWKEASSGGKSGYNQTFRIQLKPNQTYTDPLKIDLFAYPLWIEDHVKIRIK
ncbi:DUF4179 domain-containing protein [Bacillus sp. 1P06AnD]|uniref:DUF4179 domain-containing protein n=1 Tax=Bacillus sp. 1P06AnD TaxID=3132208 RepID=UPI0039A33E4B